MKEKNDLELIDVIFSKITELNELLLEAEERKLRMSLDFNRGDRDAVAPLNVKGTIMIEREI